MMVNCLPPDYVTTTILARVHFTDKPELSKYLKKTINSNQSDTRALRLHLFIYISRSKMFLAGTKYLKDSSSLRGKLVVTLF